MVKNVQICCNYAKKKNRRRENFNDILVKDTDQTNQTRQFQVGH